MNGIKSLLRRFKTSLKDTIVYDIYNKHIISKKYHRLKNGYIPEECTFQIETTNYCNAKCSFCPNSTLQRKRERMNDETFNLILQRILGEKIKVKTFILHLNGEPLTDPNICSRIKEIKKNFPKSHVRFTSNFNLSNTKIIEELLYSGLDEITISLNSINETEYKEIMGGLDYNRTLGNIDLLFKIMDDLKKNIIVNFSIVVREDNADMVEAFTKKYESRGNIRKIKLGQWVNKDIPKNIGKAKNRNNELCNILYNTINILSNGDYALCCFDAEGIIHKNIRDTAIMETYSSGVYDDIRKYHLIHGKTNEICKNCGF
jgi:MoaA/NifB/PqqE/SkfB family radical SAM enzyme